MTQIYYQETEGIGPSARVWKTINCPHGSGFFRTRGEGNPAIGFYDDFLSFSETTLTDGYIHLETATGAIAQIASTATAPGIVRLQSKADNDEAVIQLGNGLDVGAFRLQKDFAFEARVRVDAEMIVAGDHGFFVGMATGGAAGCAMANQLFTTGDAIYGTADLVGFQKLAAESTALDAMYQASGQTKVDGAVDTDLDTVETLVADTWVKLGFRFTAGRPRKLEWFVNGVKEGEITETGVAAAAFPDADTAFMQPTIGVRGADAPDAYIDIDWWACAQLY
jgi:hypothetical protein